MNRGIKLRENIRMEEKHAKLSGESPKCDE